MGETPKGVVAVFVGPDGRCIAAVNDFNTDGYGGFTTQEAQTLRVKDAIARTVAEAFASSEFTKHLSSYHIQETLRAMQHSGGYKLHILPVGYDEAAE